MSKAALWKFTADGKGGGAWSLQEPENPTLFSGLHATEYGAFTQTNTTGFIIGGVSHAWTELNHPSAEPIPGMATFDMKTKLWQNGTTNFSPFGAGTLNQASAEYIAGFGEDGLIITLAGYTPALGGNLNDSDGPPLDLRNLTFFNPQTKKRYWQVASGFLFGGTNGRDKYNYQDTYILSLPGFVWTRAPDPPGGARTGHVRTISALRTRLELTAADGLLLFDMTTLQWKDSYDANAAAYERADDLKTWYGNGSLDKVEWSSDEVRKLFVAATSSTSESGSTPVGAIVGGVVGGIGGLALIGVIAWFVIRRRKHQRQPLTPASASNPNTYVPPGETRESKHIGIPEADSSHGYTEMPASSGGFMHHSNGPVEMDPHARPAELDATPTGWR
ncbi:hypothetical protein NEMBOFW57_007667 [Staphylotrichum longicolle]|uniref:Kelch repeat protein n=1 Tax=Staphylotrichum longicolle TaxID=669026 RepID=A0AAD4EZK7_9PEZI|nr:hypothetical protein NEMBOFW57_007667 [Staphylotrichum longicolle]